MSDFPLPRITEKKYLAISPQVLTANGTVDGLITIENTYCFKVGQVVLFKQGATHKQAKIQRVHSETQFTVIEPDQSIITADKLDMSSFLIGDTVEFKEKKRPVIDLLEIQRQVYEEEPTVALRTHLVDWLGRSYDATHPLPVQLSDGSIDIGTVNAELEVQLSHRDNYPDVGDVHDSVRIGDGTDLLEINPDGSINTKLTFPSVPKVHNISIPLASTEVSFVIPAGTRKFRFKIRENSKAQIAYASTESGTKFFSVPPGSVYIEEDVDAGTSTLYFQTVKASQTAEIITWE